MLAVESKKTDKVDLAKPLQDYLRTHFPEQAESYAEQLRQLNSLRENIRNTVDKSEATRDLLLRYYGMLQCLEKHFPIGEEPEQVRIKFVWYDAFKGKKKERYSLGYEKANTLFNIAATISQVAVLINRDSPEGLKKSAAYFQTASGVYDQLREFLQSHSSEQVTSDLSADALQMLSTLLLAQAQQCFLQKAIKDAMRPPALAKLAAQVADYYDAANHLLGAAGLKGMDASWGAACSLLSATFAALAHYQLSIALHQEEKYGDECGQLQAALRRFEGTAQHARQVPDDINEFVSRYQALIGKAAAAAERENDTIYHEMVPASVPPLARHSMVKPARLPDAQLALPADPFAALVPFHVTESASIYSERKAELVRAEGRLAEEQVELAKRSLASMNLPGALLALEQRSGLPPALQQAIDRLRQDGGAGLVEEQLTSVEQGAARAAETMAAAQKMLNDEEAQDSRLRAQYGEQWRRSPSHALTTNLRHELGKFAANLDAARKSDALVRAKYAEHRPMLLKLSGSPDDLRALLPEPSPVPAAPQAYDTSKLRQLLSQLENVLASRQALLQALRQAAEKDDITDKLLASGSTAGAELVFAEELRKYEPQQQQLRQSAASQAQCLAALAAENERFVAASGRDERGRQREAALQRLDVFFRAYGELKANLREGLQFYKHLGEDLALFRAKCEDFALARQLEMQDALAALQQPEPPPPAAAHAIGWRPAAPAPLQFAATPAQQQPQPQPPPYLYAVPAPGPSPQLPPPYQSVQPFASQAQSPAMYALPPGYVSQPLASAPAPAPAATPGSYMQQPPPPYSQTQAPPPYNPYRKPGL